MEETFLTIQLIRHNDPKTDKTKYKYMQYNTIGLN